MSNSPPRITAKNWLRQNGYPDVADIIDVYMDFNKSRGSGERRNYWDLLVGQKDGKPLIRHGFTFPILKSVRKNRRPDFKPSKHAIKRNRIEIIPLPMKQARWEKKYSNSKGVIADKSNRSKE
jgi:hypothetical protein